MSPPNDALSSGLSRAELTTYIRRFGVAEEQIRRDHLISILLAAISNSQLRDQVVFFGGTALARTHLVDFRLSEDIDLLALAPRTQVAAALRRVLDRGVARTHGQANWVPDPGATKGSEPATMRVDEGLRVQVQILPGDRRRPSRLKGLSQPRPQPGWIGTPRAISTTSTDSRRREPSPRLPPNSSDTGDPPATTPAIGSSTVPPPRCGR